MALFPRAAVVPTAPNESNASVILQQEIISWCFLVAILTVLVYDAVTTMDKEVKYFWVLPLKPVGIVYFANRYIGLLGAVSNLFIDTFNATLNLCKFAIWSRSLSYWATIVLIDYILMIRVLALYQKDRRLTLWLEVLLIVSGIIKLALLIYITDYQKITVYNVAKDHTICGEERSASIGWGIADWLAPVIYSNILLILAVLKARTYWQQSAGFRGSRLVKLLIHDQVIYFILVVSCCVLNILQFKIHVTDHVLAGFISTLGSPSLLSILGSRMLFNLKEAGNVIVDERVESRVKSISAIEFVTLRNLSARV